MDFMKSLSIAASGLKAQASRMRVISENVANADSTALRPDQDPYRRKVPTFQRHYDREMAAEVVQIGKVARDQTPFQTRFEPGHPAADRDGNVKVPNVNSVIETMDLREAQRSYEANLNVMSATRRMLTRTIEMLKV